MDVLNTLKSNMSYIVGSVFANVNNDHDRFLDEMYKMIEFNIGINFDSSNFYLLDYTKLDQNMINFSIDDQFVPVELLIMIKNLIKHNRLKENIKNKKYLIHFRDFADEVMLEDKQNTLRVSAFIQMHKFFTDPIKIRIFLINKLVGLQTELRNCGENNLRMIDYKIQIYRVKAVLKAIEKNTVLLL